MRALFYTRIADKDWQKKEVQVNDAQDIKALFDEKRLTQIDFDGINRLVGYSVENLTNEGVTAKITDTKGDIQFMCSPLIVVEAKNAELIDLTSDAEKLFEEKVQLL